MDPLAPPSRGAETEGAILSGPVLTRSVMVQTDYREAETQTDPYTPEYVVLPGSQQTQKPQRTTLTEWSSAMCACCILPYCCIATRHSCYEQLGMQLHRIEHTQTAAALEL